MIAIFFIIALTDTPRKRNHRRKIDNAESHLEKLRVIQNKNDFIRYITQKADPYEFEEMVLTAFRDCGAKIKRNKSYSGDGGIDGCIRINNEWFYIQAKKYQGAIDKKHVSNFIKKCKNEEIKGIFVHTGKESKSVSKMIKNEDVISVKDNRLFDLMNRELKTKQRTPFSN